MEKPTEKYGKMLEKYREIDEDEILSNLTQEELQQLEGEIDREVLNKIPEDVVEEDQYIYSSSEDYSSTSEEEDEREAPKSKEAYPFRRNSSQTKSICKTLKKQASCDEKLVEQRKRPSKTPHQFKVPPLRKTKSKDGIRRQKSEEGGELKKELMQAVKKRTKRRTSRANSSGINRRYNRRNSSSLLKRRTSKAVKEERSNPMVNANFITQEMLSLRPKLKKVQTREPAKLNDVLHGVSLNHITSGVKEKTNLKICQNEEETSEEAGDIIQSDVDPEENDLDYNHPPVADAVAKANDNVHRRLNARPKTRDSRNDDTMSSTTAGSTSAESYDVVGELSINSNSVEDTILKVWDDDEDLTEVNLNNIQNVDMEVFEELASAMECNTHVKHLCLANVGLTDKPARALASMLKRNHTLEKLNVESNFITGDAALRLVVALRRNSSLTELRIDNQRHIFGAKVEHEFSKILKDNKTLLRFGYQFANPGPRMAASNTLTRNMDDVRKKRVIEQRKRAQSGHINRPLIRRQSSSEWYRKERADKIKKLKEQGISLDLQGAMEDDDVQKVLSNMKPAEYAMLEQWFINRLLGKTENSIEKESNHSKESHTTLAPPKSQSKHQNLRKVKTPDRQPSPRDKLLQSIRNQSNAINSKKSQHNSKTTPSSSDAENTAPSAAVDNVDEENVQTPFSRASEKDSIKSAEALNAASSTNESDEILSWKEGDEYDSDEYEVIEIEVSESDDDIQGEDGNIQKEEIAMSNKTVNYNTKNDNSLGQRSNNAKEEFLLPGTNNSTKKNEKEKTIKALDRLQIHNKYPSSLSNSEDERSPTNLKSYKEHSPMSSSSSISSCSPSTLRKVRDDDSWISSRPYYKLGAK